MFLGTIDESIKASILDLALVIAKSDSEYSDPEEAIIAAYKKEMGISHEPQDRKLDAILSDLSKASDSDKKKILFEMTSLVLADSNFSDDEEKLLNEIAVSFGLDRSYISDSIKIYDDLSMLYQKAAKLVN
jgi:hypothetical protein